MGCTLGTARVRAIQKLGGNPNLDPETAKSWTVGFDVQPPQPPGLKLSGTWYETRFVGRIDRPLISAPRGTVLIDPAYAPFVQKVSAATNSADDALLRALLADPIFNPALGTFAPSEYGAILDQRYVNTAGERVRGVDGQVGYSFAGLGGRFSLEANGAWILDFKQAITPQAPYVEFAGLVGHPARFRGRVGIDWTRDALSLGASLNHVSALKDIAGAKVEAYDTVDLRARWSAPQRGAWRGVAVNVNVRNAFDAAPPFYNNPTGYGFDATNADVIGRFVSVQLAKSW